MRQSDGKEVDASRLGDLLELVIDYRGKTPKKLGGDFAESGVPVISAIHIKNGRIAWEERERFVTQEMFKKWMKDPLKKGDVLLTSEAPLGEVALVPNDDDLVLSQRLFAMRPNPQLLDATYLMYFLKSPIGQRELSDRATGSTVVGIRQAELVDILISYPSPSRQRFIGEVLSNLDFKIDKNQELSKSLELIAWTVFKSWFIDFDPVKAKVAGEAPVGMDAETAAFFPDSMDDSELGEIPSGWRVSNVGSLVQLAGGATPSTKNPEFWDGEYSWLTPKDLSGRRQKIAPPPSRKITLRGLERISSGLLEKGTVLLSSRAPIGYTAICATETAVNQGFIALKADELFPPMYLLNWVEANMQEILNRAGGATFSEVSKAAFRDIPFLCPDAGILHRYREVTAPIVSQLEVLEAESRSLAELRDTLLPRLISGELEIPEEMLAA